MPSEISCQTAAAFAAVAVLAVASMVTARAADELNDSSVQAQIDHGKATYAQKCSHCHGPNLMNSGTVTPDLRGFPDDKPRFVTIVKQGKPATGFDVTLAQGIADRLGRPLKIQWFESKLDEDSSPQLEANALLSDGRCSLVGGYALIRDSLVVPGVRTAKLPGFEGATRDDRRRRIELGVLTPSEAYIYSPLTVVLGPKMRGRRINDIGDLSGLRLLIESGTLGDAILMSFERGRLIDNITHLVPGRDDLLGALDSGDYDATLLDLARFDAYCAAHRDTGLSASGYYYPIGVNRGYVALASEPALLAAVNKALTDLKVEGKIADLAKQAGLTYLPPREPAILDNVWEKIFQK